MEIFCWFQKALDQALSISVMSSRCRNKKMWHWLSLQSLNQQALPLDNSTECNVLCVFYTGGFLGLLCSLENGLQLGHTKVSGGLYLLHDVFITKVNTAKEDIHLMCL